MEQTDRTEKEGLILIVDDIPKNLQVLGQTLRGAGYQVAAVSKAEQVVPSARKYKPELYIA